LGNFKCPHVLNLYKETSGSMISDNGLEGKLLISDLKRTMTSIELLALYPLAPGFFLEVILPKHYPELTLLSSRALMNSQPKVVWILRLHCRKSITVTDENEGAYLCLHVIHSLLFYEPRVLQGVTHIHIMFLCVTICILISALADRLFINNQNTP
jgi:hypothetical protein